MSTEILPIVTSPSWDDDAALVSVDDVDETMRLILATDSDDTVELCYQNPPGESAQQARSYRLALAYNYGSIAWEMFLNLLAGIALAFLFAYWVGWGKYVVWMLPF